MWRCVTTIFLLCMTAGPVAALTAATPAGDTLVIVDQRLPGGETHRLERRGADGRPDGRYGSAGGAAFALGPEGEPPALLVPDATGRAWVAGGAMTNDGQRTVVLRFTPQGLPDRGFGRNGRAELAPGDHETRPLQVLPQADGSAWIAGMWIDDAGDEKPGLWRVRADGLVDAGIGQRGLWQLPGSAFAEPVALLTAPSGETALGLKRGDGASWWLEAYVWRAGEAPRPLPPQPLAAGDTGTWQLAWREGGWVWHDGRTALPAVAQASAVQEAPETAIATPFVDRPAVAASAPAPEEGGFMLGWWLLPAALVAGGWWWWRRPGG